MKLKKEVGPVVVLVRAVDGELTKKVSGSATSAATLVTKVKAVLRATGCVAVTKVVISGPGGAVAAVIFEGPVNDQRTLLAHWRIAQELACKTPGAPVSGKPQP
jgi:hypothetical protein